MKNYIKILIVFIASFFTIEMICAQNDSIYGLKASVKDNMLNLSFYSTYDMNDLTGLFFDFYDGKTQDTNARSFWHAYNFEYRNNIFYSKDFDSNVIHIESISEKLYKINITNMRLNEFFKNKSYRLYVYLQSEEHELSDNAEDIHLFKTSNALLFLVH